MADERQKGLVRKDVDLTQFQLGVDDAQSGLQAIQNKQYSGPKAEMQKATDLRKAQEKLAAANKQLELANSGRNSDGSYRRPEFESLINPETGLLYDEYKMGDDWQDVNVDTRGLDKYREEALRDGGSQSAWAQMMTEKNNLNKEAEIDNIAKSGNAAMRMAQDNLAAQGGIGGGQMQNLARSSMRDLISGRQNARRAAQMDNLNVGVQDEQNRINMLSQVPQMDMGLARFNAENQAQKLGYKQQDITNSLSAMDRERGDAMDAWRTNMETWASNKQADAQARASRGGGCFIGSTLIKMEDGTEKPISRIMKGDKVLDGGKVLSVLTFMNPEGHELYQYGDVLVTAQHAVYENGEWIRVEDSMIATKTKIKNHEVWNLNTKNHRIVIGDILFADFDEVDNAHQYTDEDCLRKLNEKDKKRVS